jgi:sigma-B regulation protein RsbU (phosphoserine phosphatase)
MARINEALVGQNLSYATFATAIYGTINTETLEMSFARGGHPNPIILRNDGTTEILPADGSLLGIFPDEVFTTTTTRLHSGDRLLIYTDGIEVAFSEDRQTADHQQWYREVQRRRNLSGAEIIRSMEEHLDGESGSLSPKDDLTIIVAEVE